MMATAAVLFNTVGLITPPAAVSTAPGGVSLSDLASQGVAIVDQAAQGVTILDRAMQGIASSDRLGLLVGALVGWLAALADWGRHAQ